MILNTEQYSYLVFGDYNKQILFEIGIWFRKFKMQQNWEGPAVLLHRHGIYVYLENVSKYQFMNAFL